MSVIIPARCTNKACESTELSWTLGTRVASGIADGRLSGHDVTPLLVLGCDECSETIATIDGDRLVNQLVRGIVKKVEVKVDRREPLVREVVAAARVRDFITLWNSMEGRGDEVYALGGHRKLLALTISDATTLVRAVLGPDAGV
jgi:hypothetical protein